MHFGQSDLYLSIDDVFGLNEVQVLIHQRHVLMFVFLFHLPLDILAVVFQVLSEFVDCHQGIFEAVFGLVHGVFRVVVGDMASAFVVLANRHSQLVIFLLKELDGFVIITD